MYNRQNVSIYRSSDWNSIEEDIEIEDLIDRSLEEFSLREKYHLLLYLEEDISIIQNYLSIVSYTDEEMIKEEAEKDVRAYIQKFRCFKCGNTEIHQ
ncbi:hypothetical protein C1645_838814 [Glomus cerebriforme]|uniref:Uncharacterized protein n=1 Tax=Glomus cerebriforme TaxID=658196 RepID=A0A397S326_9GLOM|nr:hypothetical protein C1645_838814 [Glomus cerebriforme]